MVVDMVATNVAAMSTNQHPCPAQMPCLRRSSTLETLQKLLYVAFSTFKLRYNSQPSNLFTNIAGSLR